MRIGIGARTLGVVFVMLSLGFGCKDDSDPEPTPEPTPDAGPTTPDPSGFTWTMMGGDARNHYNNALEKRLHAGNAKDLKQKWAFEVAGYPPGSPVVVDGKVFVMATGGSYAIDLKTGAEIWQRMDLAGTASAAYADGFVYLHTANANLWKVNAADGTTVWGPVRTYELPSCDGTSSPVIAGDKVLVGHSCGIAEVTGNQDQEPSRGGVEAFLVGDGTRAWSYYTVPETGENGAMVWSTVGVDVEGKVVYATTGNNYTLVGENSDSIHAIDLETGARIWKTQVRAGDVWSLGSKTFTAPTGPSIDTDFGANPIVADVEGKKLVAAGDKGSAFWALDRETGEIVWSRDELSTGHTPNNGGILMNGAFDGKNFYALVNDPPMQSLLRVFDAVDGHDVREPVKFDATAWGAPSIANGLIFATANSVLKIFEADTLELLASLDTGGTMAAGAPVVVDGDVIVASGLTYMFAQDALTNNKIICYSLDAPVAPAPMEGGKPSGAATWSAVYEESFVAGGCTGAGLCHGGAMGMGALSFETKAIAYKALVGVKAMGMNADPNMTPNCKDVDILRVAPGDPDKSLLVQKVSGTHTCGDSMPPGSTLMPAQIAQIRAWIEAGAKED